MASNKTNTKGVVVVVGGISKEKQIKVSCENNLDSVVWELVSDFFAFCEQVLMWHWTVKGVRGYNCFKGWFQKVWGPV